MIKKMIENKIIRISNNESICLKYYLTERLIISPNSSNEQIIYGIIVEKYTIEDSQEVYVCSKEAKGVSTKLDVVSFLLQKLANGTVTPTTLLEILDELIN